MINQLTNEVLFSFLIVGSLNLLAAISPGPDFAVLVKTAITQPRKKAIFTALGISLGILVHISYCILGLALIISKSILLFNIIKYLGAAYFIYLGIQGLRAKKPSNNSQDAIHNVQEITYFTALKRGFLCNVLNPKATMFFLGLFTLVVKPHTPVIIQVLYGMEMFLTTFSWFSLLATFITHTRVKNKITRFQYYITKVMGGLLFLFGCKLAFMEHR